MSAGTIAAGQAVSLVLTYDITQNTFQTVLQAAVLITTSGRPAAKVGLPLMLSHAISPSKRGLLYEHLNTMVASL